MKDDIHPNNYRPVVFVDISTNTKFMTRSTIRSSETIKWEDGKEYPLVKMDITSYSHPFFTGKQRLMDAQGRVEKFMQKYKKTATPAKPKK